MNPDATRRGFLAKTTQAPAAAALVPAVIDVRDFKEDAIFIERCRISNFTGDSIHLSRIWLFTIMGNQGDGPRQSRGRTPGTLVRGVEDYGGVTEVGQSFRTEHPENGTKRRSAGSQDTRDHGVELEWRDLPLLLVNSMRDLGAVGGIRRDDEVSPGLAAIPLVK